MKIKLIKRKAMYYLANLSDVFHERFSKKATKENTPKELLETICKTEKYLIRANRSYGVYLEELMITDNGLQQLGLAASELLSKYPNSILLNYLKVVSLAENGNIQEAHEHISNAIIFASKKNTNFLYIKKSKIKEALRKRTLIKLLLIWRTLDLIAKRHMQWAYGDSDSEKQYIDLDLLSIIEEENKNEFHPNLNFAFLEPILQGKNQEEYLSKCKNIFENVNALSQKLKAIEYMCRQGVRRVPSHSEAYALARESYDEIRKEIITKISTPYNEIDNLRAFVNLLSKVIDLSMLLKIDRDLRKAKQILIKLALSDNGKLIVYQAAHILVKIDPIGNLDIAKEILSRAATKPEKTTDMKEFLAWAGLTQEYELGYEMYSKKSYEVKARRSSGEYIKILQRLGKFKGAKEINSWMHSKILTSPYTMNPYTSWSLIRRTKELAFLEKTSEIYLKVPQPSKPKGVVFITSRNIEQLTKAPLVVLMELKRMGWAVIPLVNGLLPKEETGIKDIDCFIGSITLDREISVNVKNDFEEIDKFNFQPLKGTLNWKDINLSHILWEDATINRRVYEPDYSCPKLETYLGNLVKWTDSSTYILHNAKIKLKQLNLRAGFLISFNTRLPDAIYRFYCEKYGDINNFFVLHSANGYQNYFSNFSTNVSTKSIMRNMTEHPETRSGSFPVPSDFEKYYNENKHNALEVLKRVENITKMKRSTAGEKELPEEAKNVLQKISDWKNNGGKVACAFGKVVFDSSVPYDGGPIHKNMKEWINNTIDIVKDSDTLLLIKPHPHEINQHIASFPNAYFSDLITTQLNDNVIILGHRWLDLHMLEGIVDLGLIYNGTTSIELGILGIPTIVCSHFAPIDYPIGHSVPKSKSHYKDVVLFKESIVISDDIQKKAALWLDYMGGNNITLDYRYHSRQITNKIVYPPYWFDEDVEKYFKYGDENVTELAKRAIS